ncbi:unnamed protein product, partial [Heterotrigona itama]
MIKLIYFHDQFQSLSLPVLAEAITILLFDRNFNTLFFHPIASLNFIVTIFMTKNFSLNYDQTNLFSRSISITIITCEKIQFYINILFPFFEHPEVCILILPGFRLISQIIINERGRNEILGNLRIIYAIIGIGFLGFI